MGRPRQPALDGVRGVAVAMVLLFHGGFGFASGGYLGVSVFFTLSGFLITRLLVDEYRSTERIDLAAFWSRRVRRLAPASTACLVGVVVARSLGAFPNVVDLRPDVLGAVLQVANWVQLGGDVSYAEQVAGGRSPLDHFWSLAVEEQFYWCWPLAMVFVLRSPSPRRRLVAVSAVAFAAAPIVALAFGGPAAYWSTPARVGEILVGACAASFVGGAGRHPTRTAWLGVAGAATVLVCVVTWPADGGPATAGWLPVFSLASAAVVVAADRPSWFGRALEARPLVGLGRISYGVYLYHWPIFLLLAPSGDRTTARFAAGVAITIVVAVASHRWLESPILEQGRSGRPRPGRDLAWAGSAVGAVVLVAVVLPLDRPDPYGDLSLALAEPAVSAGTGTTTPDRTSGTTMPTTMPPNSPTTTVTSTVVATTAPSTVPDPSEAAATPRQGPLRVLVAGDSVAWTVGVGLADWSEEHPDEMVVGIEASISCGFIQGAAIPAFGDEYAADCADLIDRRVPEAIASGEPDVVVLMSTRADVQPHLWEGEVEARMIGDPVFRARHVADLATLTRRILDLGVGRVVWLTSPTARASELGAEPMTDPGAMAALADHLVAAVGLVGDRAAVVDLAGWYRSSGLDDDEVRPDGLHFDGDHPRQIADLFLARQLLEITTAPTD